MQAGSGGPSRSGLGPPTSPNRREFTVSIKDYQTQLQIILVLLKLGPMYVCICNGHREHDIREAAAKGLRCAREIYKHLGKPARCGRCLDFATQVVEEVHGASNLTAPVAKSA
jgi:bacterioferritin-associated ferredoxin